MTLTWEAVTAICGMLALLAAGAVAYIQSVISVKLGKFLAELDSRFATTTEVARIDHRLESVAKKVYDMANQVTGLNRDVPDLERRIGHLEERSK